MMSTIELSRTQNNVISRDAGVSSPTRAALAPRVGKGCKFGKDVVIERNVTIGDHCVIGNGVHIGASTIIGDGCVIEDNVRVESHVHLAEHVRVHTEATIELRCSVGAHAVVESGARMLPSSKLGNHALICKGSLVCGEAELGDSGVLEEDGIIYAGVVLGPHVHIGTRSKVAASLSEGSVGADTYITSSGSVRSLVMTQDVLTIGFSGVVASDTPCSVAATRYHRSI